MRYSYTSLKTFLTCPLHFKAKYVEKRLPKEQDAPALKRGREVHERLEFLFREPQAAVNDQTCPVWTPPGLIEKLRAAGARAEVGLAATTDWKPTTTRDPNTHFIGYIDVLLQGNDRALLIDWKTGKYRPDELQADVYAALLRAKLGLDFPVEFHLVYVDEGKTHPIHPDRFATERVQRLTELADAETEYPARPSFACRWCPVTDCKYNGG